MPYQVPSVLPLVLLLVIDCCLLVGASPTLYRNITMMPVPHPTPKREVPKLSCPPVPIPDVVIFFVGNYLAHAVTVKSYPGESSTATLLSFIAALAFPASGLVRGLNAISRCAILKKGSLERAAQSGALCMVVRNDSWMPCEHRVHIKDMRLVSLQIGSKPLPPWRRVRPLLLELLFILYGLEWPGADSSPQGSQVRPDDGSTDDPQAINIRMHVREALMWDTRNFYIGPRSVQGTHYLPTGYSFAFVPRTAKVVGLVRRIEPELAPYRSVPKALIGIVQIVFSSFTLYRSRGALINHLGYASYSLTVLPYASLTFVNLVGNLLTPDYPALYLGRIGNATRSEETALEPPSTGSWVGWYRLKNPSDIQGVQLMPCPGLSNGSSMSTGAFTRRLSGTNLVAI
ncbi:hypothetical protein C8J57DRAFT_1067362 [Mycena rebaudengoi]|nr:hypothetical protein C8J57DRAFT_1067362 [Mycena rebaudengoi]